MSLKLQRSLLIPLALVAVSAHFAVAHALFAKDAAPAPAAAAAAAAAAAPDALPHATTVSKLASDASLRTPSGAELEVLQFETKKDPEFRFLVQGGLHGNEEQGSEFVRWLARRYAHGESLLNQLAKEGSIAIDFLPVANPDGQHADSRYNNHGVNLNRNFGVLWGVTKENPGSGSFSEPETRAIRSLFLMRHYTAAVDVHGYVNWIVSPSAPEAVMARGVKASKERIADYRRWRSGLRDEMKLLTGYQLKTGATLGDGGAFEDWAFWNQGTFAYCLEMETFQRFVRPYRHDFNDLNSTVSVGAAPMVDLFKRYETFIYRTFAKAVELKKAPPKVDNLAGQ